MLSAENGRARKRVTMITADYCIRKKKKKRNRSQIYTPQYNILGSLRSLYFCVFSCHGLLPWLSAYFPSACASQSWYFEKTKLIKVISVIM